MTQEVLITDWLIPILVVVTILYACGCLYLMYRHERRTYSHEVDSKLFNDNLQHQSKIDPKERERISKLVKSVDKTSH